MREKYLLEKRFSVVKSCLEKNKLLTKSYSKKVPVISVCSSGGGFRSMLATIGFFNGLKDIGLIDAVSYISTISGSSWALAPWILEGKNINEFEKNLINRLDFLYKFKHVSDIDLSDLKSKTNFFKKIYYDFLKVKKNNRRNKKATTVIDFYGTILSNVIFGDSIKSNLVNLKLSDLSTNMDKGSYPLPIFSVASQFNFSQYHWLNFDPFYVESDYLKKSVYSHNFGKKFSKGIMLDSFSDTNLIFLLGVFGSAFSGSLRDILDRIVNLPMTSELKDFALNLEKKISSYAWVNKKIYTANVNNFAFNIKNLDESNSAKFSIFDGGYLCNLPLEPILGRGFKSDIIFILDNTRMLPITSALKQVENQILSKGYKFPKIDYKKAESENFSVFSDPEDKDCPTIIYVPLIKDKSYSKTFDPQLENFCGTTNFFYSEDQSKKLAGLSRYVVNKNKERVFDLISQLKVS